MSKDNRKIDNLRGDQCLKCSLDFGERSVRFDFADRVVTLDMGMVDLMQEAMRQSIADEHGEEAAQLADTLANALSAHFTMLRAIKQAKKVNLH